MFSCNVICLHATITNADKCIVGVDQLIVKAKVVDGVTEVGGLNFGAQGGTVEGMNIPSQCTLLSVRVGVPKSIIVT